MNWKEHRLCIGLCNHQDKNDTDFFWSFQNIIKPDFYVVARGNDRIKSGSLNQVVRLAWQNKCDKVLLMDVDQVFPQTVIKSLLERKLPIVSGSYYLKSYPHSPVAGWTERGERVNQNGVNWKLNYTPFPDNDDHLVEVDWCGVGCLMIDMDVFEKLQFPCFYDDWNWDLGTRKIGHDMLFCQDVKRAGYKIYVDTAVQCGHIGIQIVDKNWVDAYYESGMNEVYERILKDETKTALYWDDIYSAEKERSQVRLHLKEWSEAISHMLDGSKVADVGCGTGMLMAEIKNQKKDVSCYGYDISPTAIDLVHEKGFEGEVADFRNFSPNGRTFDTVISSHLLEHFKDGDKFLKTCASLLDNHESQVIALVPAREISVNVRFEHETHYTEQTLEDEFGKVFVKVDVKKIGDNIMAIGKEVL